MISKKLNCQLGSLLVTRKAYTPTWARKQDGACRVDGRDIAAPMVGSPALALYPANTHSDEHRMLLSAPAFADSHYSTSGVGT